MLTSMQTSLTHCVHLNFTGCTYLYIAHNKVCINIGTIWKYEMYSLWKVFKVNIIISHVPRLFGHSVFCKNLQLYTYSKSYPPKIAIYMSKMAKNLPFCVKNLPNVIIGIKYNFWYIF